MKSISILDVEGQYFLYDLQKWSIYQLTANENRGYFIIELITVAPYQKQVHLATKITFV